MIGQVSGAVGGTVTGSVGVASSESPREAKPEVVSLPSSEAKPSALPHQTADFRLYLQSELVNRCRKNPKYSMRAFAKVLRIENSALSKILRGKRRLTRPMLINLAGRLGMGPAEISAFEKHLIENDARAASEPSGPPMRYEQLTLDAFTVISDWYHYAILELTRIEAFRAEPKWVASVLDVSPAEVMAAVERLVRLGLMRIEDDGRWRLIGYNTTIANNFTDAAFRKFQRQVLEKAIVALEQFPMEIRDQSNMTMAVDTRRLPEAKEMIKNFRRKLSQFLESSEKRDQVYQLSISLYPLTQIKAQTVQAEGDQ